LADLKLERAAEQALLKLLAALPSIHRRGAERARQRIYVDVTGWHRPEEAVPLLPVLQEAIWLERKLHFTYQSGIGCNAIERLVDPLGLVAKGSVWYLVAAVGGDVRSYRVSRVQNAKLMEEPCTCPAGFVLATYWEQSAARFKANLPSYHATMRVRPDIVHRLSFGGRFARIEEIGKPDECGWVPVSLRFDVEEMACEYALSFGPAMEVIEPESLRQKVLEAATIVAALYTRAASKGATG
jgi:predicted DNA-binding transcriptional regulator YafY